MKKVSCIGCMHKFYNMCHAPALMRIQHGSSFPLGYRIVPANTKKQNRNHDCTHFERRRG